MMNAAYGAGPSAQVMVPQGHASPSLDQQLMTRLQQQFHSLIPGWRQSILPQARFSIIKQMMVQLRTIKSDMLPQQAIHIASTFENQQLLAASDVNQYRGACQEKMREMAHKIKGQLATRDQLKHLSATHTPFMQSIQHPQQSAQQFYSNHDNGRQSTQNQTDAVYSQHTAPHPRHDQSFTHGPPFQLTRNEQQIPPLTGGAHKDAMPVGSAQMGSVLGSRAMINQAHLDERVRSLELQMTPMQKAMISQKAAQLSDEIKMQLMSRNMTPTMYILRQHVLNQMQIQAGSRQNREAASRFLNENNSGSRRDIASSRGQQIFAQQQEGLRRQQLGQTVVPGFQPPASNIPSSKSNFNTEWSSINNQAQAASQNWSSQAMINGPHLQPYSQRNEASIDAQHLSMPLSELPNLNKPLPVPGTSHHELDGSTAQPTLEKRRQANYISALASKPPAEIRDALARLPDRQIRQDVINALRQRQIQNAVNQQSHVAGESADRFQSNSNNYLRQDSTIHANTGIVPLEVPKQGALPNHPKISSFIEQIDDMSFPADFRQHEVLQSVPPSLTTFGQLKAFLGQRTDQGSKTSLMKVSAIQGQLLKKMLAIQSAGQVAPALQNKHEIATFREGNHLPSLSGDNRVSNPKPNPNSQSSTSSSWNDRNSESVKGQTHNRSSLAPKGTKEQYNRSIIQEQMAQINALKEDSAKRSGSLPPQKTNLFLQQQNQHANMQQSQRTQKALFSSNQPDDLNDSKAVNVVTPDKRAPPVEMQKSLNRVQQILSEQSKLLPSRRAQKMNVKAFDTMKRKLEETASWLKHMPFVFALTIHKGQVDLVARLSRQYLLLRNQYSGQSLEPAEEFSISSSELDEIIAALRSEMDKYQGLLQQKRGDAEGNRASSASSKRESKTTTSTARSRASKKKEQEVSTPGAPISTHATHSFGKQSPQGTAVVYRRNELTQDKLVLPPNKRRKPNVSKGLVETKDDLGENAHTDSIRPGTKAARHVPEITNDTGKTVSGEDLWSETLAEIRNPLPFCLNSLKTALNLDIDVSKRQTPRATKSQVISKATSQISGKLRTCKVVEPLQELQARCDDWANAPISRNWLRSVFSDMVRNGQKLDVGSSFTRKTLYSEESKEQIVTAEKGKPAERLDERKNTDTSVDAEHTGSIRIPLPSGWITGLEGEGGVEHSI